MYIGPWSYTAGFAHLERLAERVPARSASCLALSWARAQARTRACGFEGSRIGDLEGEAMHLGEVSQDRSGRADELSQSVQCWSC